ncbi:inhibitor of nuclear factor kappa-B kinase subunit epsilon [Pimephales promelas]|uniref:inhibitor of nuclear factor kappa-B kinase subunit epsilon n=1 Tax=Pimephales promelas TaxID=90988 RepID=UPI001955675E|nr:inhibitor of nuclear factor kappa-B kinase subunit epsilon [Pimephales promelas]XP_039529201.1 inhibitor of nuclear factor kappa-B kinase subunit epsilon [Pimephales promelas]KAG1949472.1 inhibitor of nuclear factor kappa-B kinase subunit epsilon [Pimephales promelas]KAG1949473.1 inhibitor of nuclear factor kappa-B kinase subunit epsilon [Pimephales promelas]
MSSACVNMASTANYLWSLDDVLGQGATASVFKARNKKTGELVAVKVFNLVSYNRPYEVQMREFEVLQRLNHVNIVKLFAVEEMHMNPKQRVLVMEFCSGGSLLNLLEEPENAFGLPESEFLIVLQCVVQGMNHLRENGVVHRDIKPGNIMRQVGEDGRSVYKLTDFGAARELEDDEKFVSIYGTEEYLHPDMYERAVLRKPQQKTYGVSVDLWSIGVTFYHAASGSLPFIPFGGPRKNKKIMYKITTEKPEGAIAGVQKVEDGPIEWSYQLPQSCLLSEGLKTQLIPVLARILEANQEKCWDFVKFFAATTDILNRITVHIFFLQQATTHNIYIHFHNTVSIFFEDVQAQTGIEPAAQQYLFQGHPLILEPSMKVVNLPPTSPDHPIILISRRPEKLGGYPYREPEAPAMPTKFDIMADYSFSKSIVRVIHQYLHIARSFQKDRELILQGFYSYIENTGFECKNVANRIAMVNMKLLSSISTEANLNRFTQKFEHEFPEFIDNKKQLQLIEEDLQRMYSTGIREFQNELQHLHVMLSKHSETLAQDKSIQKMEVLFGKIVAVHQHYYNDRVTGKLSYNDEQIHKFEKLNLASYIRKVKTIFKDDCLQKYQDVLMAAGSWNRVLYEMHTTLEHFGGVLRQRIADLHVCEAQQNKVLDRVVFRALHQPIGAEGVDGPTKDEHMILKMNRLKDEMEAVARELQNNNNMIQSLSVVTSTLPVETKIPQPNRP